MVILYVSKHIFIYPNTILEEQGEKRNETETISRDEL